MSKLSAKGSKNPQGYTGTYNAATGTWSVWQPRTGGSTARYRFSNTRASSGRTITLSALDPDLSGPQISITAVHFEQAGSVPPDAVLLADTATARQVIEHFGASMFWTIDPTVSWPVETKEALALKLMSEALAWSHDLGNSVNPTVSPALTVT